MQGSPFRVLLAVLTDEARGHRAGAFVGRFRHIAARSAHSCQGVGARCPSVPTPGPLPRTDEACRVAVPVTATRLQ